MDLLRSLPLGLYLEQPITWLHHLDARVKLAWLMSFLIAPVLATSELRIGLVVLLIVLTITATIPLRVWRQQMGWLLIFSVLVMLLTWIAPDGLAVKHQPRLPADELAFLQQPATPPPPPPRNPWYNPFGWGQKVGSVEFARPEQGTKTVGAGSPRPEQGKTYPIQNLPQPTDYNYVLFDKGRIQINRRSVDLGIRISTLFFTLVYSTNLFLLTTAPEEITAGIESLMAPLRRFNLPVTEVALTLTLSLRFIPLVLEEVQNLIRSVRTRAINWKKLGWRGATQVWLTVIERLLENLLLRAEQCASAMQVRGFTSPNEHRVQWHQVRLHRGDWLAIAALIILWGVRLLYGSQA